MSSGYCVSKMIKISLFFMELYKNNGRVGHSECGQCFVYSQVSCEKSLPTEAAKSVAYSTACCVDYRLL